MQQLKSLYGKVLEDNDLSYSTVIDRYSSHNDRNERNDHNEHNNNNDKKTVLLFCIDFQRPDLNSSRKMYQPSPLISAYLATKNRIFAFFSKKPVIYLKVCPFIGRLDPVPAAARYTTDHPIKDFPGALLLTSPWPCGSALIFLTKGGWYRPDHPFFCSSNSKNSLRCLKYAFLFAVGINVISIFSNAFP